MSRLRNSFLTEETAKQRIAAQIPQDEKAKETDLDVLVNSVNPERLSNNPVLFDKNELREMYGEIVYES